MNARASSPSSPEWVTLQPGQLLAEAVPTKRTLRLVTDLAGRLLAGRYRVGNMVDEGALSSTYEAYDIETREQVSLELLTRPSGAGLPASKALRNEARRIVDAKHPGLRVARTVGVDGGVPFLVAEPVSGESLRQRLTRGGPLSVADCFAVSLQVVDAVAAAHAAGLVHGNLKPEKIRLEADPSGAPRAKVMGLGVTALLGTMAAVDTRRLGTPPYLAPELLSDAAGADELTDVWTIGLLIYEMLTGRRTFDGATSAEVARRIGSKGIVRMRHLRPEVPLPLEQLVIATLARSRTQRLSLRDLRRALVEVQAAFLASQREVRVTAPLKIYDLTDPSDDDGEGTTDLYVHVETDLGSLEPKS